MKAEGRHALVRHWLCASEPVLDDYRPPTLEGERHKTSSNPTGFTNRNIHQALLMKLGDRRRLRANNGPRHVWFVHVTKSWTLGFVLKWKLAALSSVFLFFFSFQSQERKGCREKSAPRPAEMDSVLQRPLQQNNLLSSGRKRTTWAAWKVKRQEARWKALHSADNRRHECLI